MVEEQLAVLPSSIWQVHSLDEFMRSPYVPIGAVAIVIIVWVWLAMKKKTPAKVAKRENMTASDFMAMMSNAQGDNVGDTLLVQKHRVEEELERLAEAGKEIKFKEAELDSYYAVEKQSMHQRAQELIVKYKNWEDTHKMLVQMIKSQQQLNASLEKVK